MKLEFIFKFVFNAIKKMYNYSYNFLMGKPLSPEARSEAERRKKHLQYVMRLQREAEEKRDIELAKKGKYKPPKKEVKKKDSSLSNIGKHNPLSDFNNSQKFNDNILKGFEIRNPLEPNKTNKKRKKNVRNKKRR